MEAIKRTVIEIRTSDGREVLEGDTVYLVANGYALCGIFKGINKRGSWMFAGVGNLSDVNFNILPKSIEKMYLVSLGFMPEV